MRQRIESDAVIQEAMQCGVLLARSGGLQAHLESISPSTPAGLPGLRSCAPPAPLWGARAQRGTAMPEQPARRRWGSPRWPRTCSSGTSAKALGAGDVEADVADRDGLLHRLGTRIEDLQRDLKASYSAVLGDLQRAGIRVRRGRARV